MVGTMGNLRAQSAAILLCAAVTLASAHGDEYTDVDNTHAGPTASSTLPPDRNYDLFDEPSYAGLAAHSGLMSAHIGFMVLAWILVLPAGVMFSISRSKLALPVQLVFLVLNGLGVVTGTVYNINTSDLYPNNAHHKIGWIATWIFTAQVIMSLLFMYSGRNKQPDTLSSERAAFLPASLQKLNRPFRKHSWSGNSGHGTQPPSQASSSRSSRTLSPDRDHDYTKPEMEQELEDMKDVELALVRRRPSWFKNTKIDTFLSKRVPNVVSQKAIKIAEVAYEIVDRTILILGFIALTTGIVTYTGLFRANNVFNGIAHWVKGGIFFWYGLLTLGRWLGSFADLGWAWNLRPTKSEVGWKARLPTAEFVESFVIFLYGCINVWLEHLAAWGDAWTAQDIEHVSISILFFAGGLAGMLVESKRLRTWLNTGIEILPSRTEVHPEEAREIRQHPRSYTTSLNVMPAIVIFLLGIMMSSHHQDSILSTNVHIIWGRELSGFAVFRGLTYMLQYLAPPTSIYPSRPPTELAGSFLLISGGLTFMISTKDIVHYMNEYDIMSMFVFTVSVSLTLLIMAHTMLLVGLRGWAVRREQRQTSNKH